MYQVDQIMHQGMHQEDMQAHTLSHSHKRVAAAPSELPLERADEDRACMCILTCL